MTKKERMYKQIEAHGIDLNNMFNLDKDPVKLAKKIHSLEVKAHRLATDYCNGENGVTTETWPSLTDAILNKLDKIVNFKAQNIPVFVNGDARGYALKIESDYLIDRYDIHKDWGGYGILAPEFDGSN